MITNATTDARPTLARTMSPATLWVIRIGVGLVALCAAVISFDHVHRFALANGENELTAILFPLGLEGAIAGGAAAVLGWDRTSGRRPVMAWLLLLLGLVGSLAGNVAAATTVPGRIGAAVPPLLLLLGVEVLAGLSRPAKARRVAGAEPAAVQPEPAPAVADHTAGPQLELEEGQAEPEAEAPAVATTAPAAVTTGPPAAAELHAAPDGDERSAEAVCRDYWNAAIAAGRRPSGAELGRAASVNPTTGCKYRRQFEAEEEADQARRAA